MICTKIQNLGNIKYNMYNFFIKYNAFLHPVKTKIQNLFRICTKIQNLENIMYNIL